MLLIEKVHVVLELICLLVLTDWVLLSIMLRCCHRLVQTLVLGHLVLWKVDVNNRIFLLLGLMLTHVVLTVGLMDVCILHQSVKGSHRVILLLLFRLSPSGSFSGLCVAA